MSKLIDELQCIAERSYEAGCCNSTYPIAAARRVMTEAADALSALRKQADDYEAQRNFLVEEYERAVQCGPQGYVHAAMHLFNAITNARIDAKCAEAERDALRARLAGGVRVFVDIDNHYPRRPPLLVLTPENYTALLPLNGKTVVVMEAKP